MAGYLGTKAVFLNTTAASVGGDATIGGDLTVDTNTLHVDSTNNRVGIGTSSPSQPLSVVTSSGAAYIYSDNGTANTYIGSDGSNTALFGTSTNHDTRFMTNNTERMRIDSSGNLLVGTTTASGLGNSSSPEGISLSSSQCQIIVATSSDSSLYLNRQTSDGEIAVFRKNGSTIGSLGVNAGDNFYFQGSSGHCGIESTNLGITPWEGGTARDNLYDMGNPSYRWDDVYATNGTIQTSDQNEKQDIAKLSDAEQRVATAAKGLIRKYRWIDAVQEKGDDARIHVGIIAQDLQAAFEAEGLDAGDYAMFISSTWWEADETYTDDDGVEQTRTNTYETQEEAPEGATERTRLGVRYPELLAFIIGAL